ncbi:MAG: DUF1553 domain-containing protein [Candidatus Poribacteria bacterium]|nr:DUF1553 domain-containing protein [Candidatus Poribacteria bacterium]
MKSAKSSIPLTYLLVCLCILLLGVPLASADNHETAQTPVDYTQDIRPILSNNCFACHGPDEKARKANLRLDTKEGAFSEPSGYPILVPEKPDESELYLRIVSEDESYQMPPADFNKTLTPEQIETIKHWINQGAKWEDHWAFTTPVRPTLPAVKKADWVKNPIDAFILSRLEKEGLRPAEEADKRSLIRRLSFDLTGLPPTLEEIHLFLNDDSPNAYEKLINTFMAKPEYGEHMARLWLDVARYGDTHGLHLDNYREMWPYRDWVINAFNNNIPFDQFTIEQLAGDLLPEPTLDQRVATGFNRCHVTTSEGGSIAEEYYVRYAVDRANTTATVWMGLTAGCAQCHDHKYDPISQKEYYQLYAYFNNITENAMDGNRKDSPPVVKLPTPEQTAQLAKYDEQIKDLDAQSKGSIPHIDAAQTAWENRMPRWTTIKPEVVLSQGLATLKINDDNSVLASGTNPDKEVYEVIAKLPPGKWSALRLEGIPDKSLPGSGIGRSDNSNVVLTGFSVDIVPAEMAEEMLAEAQETAKKAEEAIQKAAEEAKKAAEEAKKAAEEAAKATDDSAVEAAPETDDGKDAEKPVEEDTPETDEEKDAEKPAEEAAPETNEGKDAEKPAEEAAPETDDGRDAEEAALETDEGKAAEEATVDGETPETDEAKDADETSEEAAEPAEEKDPWTSVPVVMAWADKEQSGGEFSIANAIDDKLETGWGLESNNNRGNSRQAIFLVANPFGIEGGLLRIRLNHESESAKHHLGRFRLAVTDAPTIYPIGSKVGLANWHSVGPFTAEHGNVAFYNVYEPETKPVNTGDKFTVGSQELTWKQQAHWKDGEVHNDIVGENSATYLYRNISSETKQKATLYLSSNDGLKVWVNQTEVLASNIQRDAVPDTDRIQIQLNPGNNALLLKVVNYSGPSGFYFRMESDTPMVTANIVDTIAIERGKRNGDQQTQIREYYRRNVTTDEGLKKLYADISDTQNKRNSLNNSFTTTLVMQERSEPRGAYILERGAYEHRGEQVYPQTPAALPPMVKGSPPNRLSLAKWLVSPKHPLTSRVTINRFWQHIFGAGIVRTSEDFGTQGTPPTHPELLDWLATEFVASEWDVQTMLKLMLTSATYKQSSRVTPEKLELDADNVLLSRAPRYRLDAEIVRDNVLTLSGLMFKRIGGPSVKPPQPGGLWKAVGFTGSNTDTFRKDSGSDKVHRRSLYTFWKRTAPPPQMNILDAPSREACTIRRERTNTPMQALMLMNDPQFFEAARVFAERTIKLGGNTPEERISYMFELATAREPKPTEAALLLETMKAHAEELKADPEAAKELIAVGESKPDEKLDAVEVATWTMIANLILNLDEVLNKG